MTAETRTRNAPDLASDTSSERQVVNLAFGGGLNIVGAGVNQAALFGVTILIARMLGTNEVGLYSEAFAIRALLSLVCLGGMRSALTRFVAVHLADDDAARLRGLVRYGLVLSMVASAALGVALFLVAPLLARSAFHDAALIVPLRYVALSLPPAVVTVAALSATQGFRTMRAYSIVGSIFEPLFRFGLTLALLLFGAGLEGTMVALTVASFATAVIAWWWLRRLMKRVPHVRPVYELRPVRRFARVSWASSMANQGLIWADIVILGLFVTAADVGVYQIATRLVLLAGIAVTPLNASFAPRVADLWQRRQTAALQRSYTAITGWALRICIPGIVLLTAVPEPALRVFGHDFTKGRSVILVFVFGQLVDAATSPSAIVLNMAGRNFLNMLDSIGALALNIGLNIVLIPHFGILGSAIAWTAALVAIGAIRLLQVRRYVVDRLPYNADVIKAVVAGCAALAVGLVLRQFLGGVGLLAAATLAVCATYAIVLMLFGLPADDRAVAIAMRSRLRQRVAA